MKSLLYGFFSPFGLIADIYFSRKPQMRGQAFIIFCDIVEASKAKRAMNGMSMLGRTLKIDFTTNESKIVSKTKMKVDNNSSQSVQKPVNISQQYSIDKTSCTLFVTNIPEDTLEEKLHEIFSVYDGFKAIRQEPSRKNIAFIDYETDTNAAKVKDNLQGFKITPDQAINIEFSK